VKVASPSTKIRKTETTVHCYIGYLPAHQEKEAFGCYNNDCTDSWRQKALKNVEQIIRLKATFAFVDLARQ